jgi:hypothetical protein
MASAANATLIVSTSTQVSAITGPNSADGGMHYTFSYTSTCGSTGSAPSGAVTCGPTYSPFEATVSFMNDVAGTYSFGLQTTATLVNGVLDADSDVDFTNAWLALTDGTPVMGLSNTFSNDTFELWNLSGLHLNPGSYVLHITGQRGDESTFDGSVNFVRDAVPEPSTWAFMLLGFGALGWQLRRRRPVLAQAL